VPSHARTRTSGQFPHQGAQPLPRRLSPRRTKRVLGFRVTPRQHEGFIGGLAASVLLVGISDLPQQLASALFGG
jgi:hypothetical protein